MEGQGKTFAGPKVPRDIPRVQYENQQQFRKSIKKDLSQAMRKG